MSTLCFRIDSLTDDTLTLGIYDRNPMTLQLDATAKDGSQSSSTVDMSCLSPNMSLDARCDEIVTPSVREPFSYRLSLVVFDGETELAYASTQDTGDSVTATIATSIDTLLNFSLSARISSGADGRNSYALENVSLASIIAAGSDGVKLTLVNCQDDLSGVNCSIPVWMSCVDNGSNSYTFTFMTGVEASSSTDFVLDLVSGTNRVDMKPLLEHIGGKVVTIVSDGTEPQKLVDDIPDEPSADFFPTYIVEEFLFFTSDEPDFTAEVFPPSSVESDGTTCIVTFEPGQTPSGMLLVIDFIDYDSETDDFIEKSFANVQAIDVSTQTFICTAKNLEEAYVAGAAGVTFYEMVFGESGTSVNTDESIQVVFTKISDSPYSFSIQVIEAATKKVLRLEPSCDTDIDIAPLLPTAVSDVSVQATCDTTQPYVNTNATVRITCRDSQNRLLGQVYGTWDGDMVTATLLENTEFIDVSVSLERYQYYTFYFDLQNMEPCFSELRTWLH